MDGISLKSLFIPRSVADFFCFVRVFFLLGLLFSAGAQADVLWEAQASRHLEQLLKSHPVHLLELDNPAVMDFYRERRYKPLWLNAKGRLKRADDLLHVIVHAEDEGLEPPDYYLEEIRKYMYSNVLSESIYLDLLLSAALYRYSNHVYSGRINPREVDAEWYIQNKPLDSQSLFADVASKESIVQLLEGLSPRHPGYQLLKEQLRRFRHLVKQGEWQRFEPGRVLEPGVQDSQVGQLRKRLKITGDLVAGSLPDMDMFDTTLAEAVMRYQIRHGLKVDGHVGPQTRKAMNITLRERIRQIRINMERWRWLPRELGNRYLMVNLTGFELYIMENDSRVLDMPVIIGKSYRSTPSFSSLISHMVYNPYWMIPRNLALKDIIPKQIHDPSYFAEKSIKVYSGLGKDAREIDPGTVNWDQLNKKHFPYWLRQDPGPKNALGRLKFLFPNPYDVYLHDTPDRHLFEQDVRTLSSGCIRVKDPIRLAAYLLNDASPQMEEKVLANIHLGSNQGVSLSQPVPIYLVYWTAWAGPDGSMNFRDDIYRRDVRLKTFFDS